VNLVTLREAKSHLNIDHDLDDDVIDRKRGDASSAVMNFIKADEHATDFNWVDALGEPSTDPLNKIPGEVVSATLLVLGAMYENRDGDAFRSPQPLSQAVMDLLWRHRDPAFA
jgi:hypothetical protein